MVQERDLIQTGFLLINLVHFVTIYGSIQEIGSILRSLQDLRQLITGSKPYQPTTLVWVKFWEGVKRDTLCLYKNYPSIFSLAIDIGPWPRTLHNIHTHFTLFPTKNQTRLRESMVYIDQGTNHRLNCHDSFLKIEKSVPVDKTK